LKDLGVVGEVILRLILREWIMHETVKIMLDWMSDIKLIRDEAAWGTETLTFILNYLKTYSAQCSVQQHFFPLRGIPKIIFDIPKNI
jgi:hypothetical protein